MTNIAIVDTTVYKPARSARVVAFGEIKRFTFKIVDYGSHPCAYVGCPLDHPVATSDDFDVNCHGGLTFAQQGDGELFDEELYWIGWDYAHGGDFFLYCDSDLNPMEGLPGRKWTVFEILDEVKRVIDVLHDTYSRFKRGLSQLEKKDEEATGIRAYLRPKAHLPSR